MTGYLLHGRGAQSGHPVVNSNWELTSIDYRQPRAGRSKKNCNKQ